MLKSFLALTLICALGGSAIADEASKKEKLARFIDALGMRQTFAEAQATQMEQARKATGAAVEKMIGEIENPEVRARFAQLHRDFLDRIYRLYDANASVDALAALLGKRLSEEDLDGLLKFYTSDLGRREVAAMQEATAEYGRTFSAERMARGGEAFEAFRQELMKLVRAPNDKPEPGKDGK